jgi:hypothetical protein
LVLFFFHFFSTAFPQALNGAIFASARKNRRNIRVSLLHVRVLLFYRIVPRDAAGE